MAIDLKIRNYILYLESEIKKTNKLVNENMNYGSNIVANMQLARVSTLNDLTDIMLKEEYI